MKLGIDFNQFTYIGLRRFFKDIGFRVVMDPIQLHDPEYLNNPKFWKKVVFQLLKRARPLKDLVLVFVQGTHFLCIR